MICFLRRFHLIAICILATAQIGPLSISWAGPVVIDGTDSNEHGNASFGGNSGGWLYMQQVLNNLYDSLSSNVQANHKVVVDVGTTAGTQSRSAIQSAFNQSKLPGLGWSLVHIKGVSDITSFLDGNTVQSANMATSGILCLTTVGLIDTGGDLTLPELAVINNRGPQIANFIAGFGNPANEGGVFALGELGDTQTAAYGWLKDYNSAISSVSVGSGGIGNPIMLTQDGHNAFPSLTNGDLSTGPWHDYFTSTTNTFSPLQVLATSTLPGDPNTPHALILGGQISLYPNIPSILPIAVAPGTLISNLIMGTDPRNLSLMYSFLGLTGPGGAITGTFFDSSAHTFQWNTTGFSPGVYLASFQATNSAGLSSPTTTFQITILNTPEPSCTSFVLIGLGTCAGVWRGRRRSFPKWSAI